MEKSYETVIGLEVHVELATKTKIFCGCSTAFGAEPNAHTCPVCTGMPGSLPVLNRQVLEYAAAVGLATNCEITRETKFDRKNYFYPDNPQNYQISQLYLPICRNGYVEIETDECGGAENTGHAEDTAAIANGRQTEDTVTAEEGGHTEATTAAAEGMHTEAPPASVGGKRRVCKKIGIHEIHMEEDAGKLIHDEWQDCTLVDYNRSGVPLIEIVSEPDMRSAEEVIAYLEKLRMLIQYLGASDCKLQEGSMRADVNLSVREAGAERFGTRTEMKNLNSFRAITHAIEGERERQIALLEAGEKVVQETRRWDDTKGESYAMRSKEDAQDYRYFPEPDLPPICISDEMLAHIREKQPEFREEKMARYRREYGLPEYDIDILTQSRHMAELFEQTTAICGQPKKVSNWLMVQTMQLLKEKEMDAEDICFSPEHLAKLIALTDAKAINSSVAKEVFEVMFASDIDPEQYVEEKGLKMTSDKGELKKVLEGVIAANPQSVSDYRNGKEKAIGFLVGQTMKAMKGKADPAAVNAMLREML